ncbi:vomeronasal type-2 receptor 26-like [Python bivittatus]|uniref:Vomeronasal type-2 receptor 26-like n=1 Tax=Python bivittatus TaxID=176946 RepID=A0A9F5IXP4_PYTBI|nr:vomeronasal type-2 receptor 26-like [Python bivittatus]
MVFAVKEINENPSILPNVTLGFHIYDSHFSAQKTYHATMLLLCNLKSFIPNYICGTENPLTAVIGGLDSITSIDIATILDIYKVPQFVYGSAPIMNYKTPGLSFFQMSPTERLQYEGIVSLLLYFTWTWIGVLVMENDNGERFLDAIIPLFFGHGICFALIEKVAVITSFKELARAFNQGAETHDKIMDSNANIMIFYGESYSMMVLRWLPHLSKKETMSNIIKGKVWIFTAQVEFTSQVYQRDWDAQMIHGALSFTIHGNNPPGFKPFLLNRNPSTTEDGFIKDFWQQAFNCVFKTSDMDEEILNSYDAANYMTYPRNIGERGYGKSEEIHKVLVPKYYQNIVALAFTVKEINKNPQILSNVTLGFHIYDSHFSAQKTYHATMLLIYNLKTFVPNYICGSQNHLTAVIGGLDSKTSIDIANFLDIYKIPQVKWTWIGVFVMANDNGERFIDMIVPIFSQHSICFSFIERIAELTSVNEIYDLFNHGAQIHDKIMDSSANVLIFYGESDTTVRLRWLPYLTKKGNITNMVKGKVWIFTAQVELNSHVYQRDWDTEIINGALSFTVHANDPPGFQSFIESRNPSMTEDGFIKDYWQQSFACVFKTSNVGEVTGDICTGEEKLENLPVTFFEKRMTGHSYSIYNSVYAVAHALHAMISSRFVQRSVANKGRLKLQNQDAWQLHRLLKGLSFNNSAGDQVSIDYNGELLAGYDVLNWIVSSNQSFMRVKVGRVNPAGSSDQIFTIIENVITWHSWFNQSQPVSVCAGSCWPGSRKKMKEGEPFCCYDCIPCPEDGLQIKPACSFSDTNDCYLCPYGTYPSKNQDFCIPKTLTFLSYEEPLGISSAFFVLFFSLVSVMVLGIFVKNHNTPIIIANNRDLTYILLISLPLCFLSAFLFIGHPEKVVCLLQQTTFGVIFTMSVSSVLAKTITVVLAFMATKPGSRMRMFVGKRFSNSMVISCSLIQIGICMTWLTTSPPFPDTDMDSAVEEIVLQCNQGSATMFYSVLSYLGFLAIISFVVAFLARKLPETFNESKFITFSMLVFCCVWLSFVPTYLSTKGKYTVAVEIFSILASSGGLLGCIFLPKCYIIVLRPDLNNREHLMKRKK